MSGLLVIDVAHAFWAAHLGRSNHEPGTAPIDVAASTVYRLDDGWANVVLAVDAPPYARAQRFPAYKRHRLVDELGRANLRKLLDRLHGEGYRLVGVEGHEADDVCATLARAGSDRGVEVTIATGDKDLWTLVGDAHEVIDMRGELVTAEDVRARFAVEPRALADLLSIAGDASDGIPGVPGIGVGRAGKLLAVHGSIDAMFAMTPASADEMKATSASLKVMRAERDKAKRKGLPTHAELVTACDAAAESAELASLHAAIHEHRATVEQARDLVRLVDDLPLDFATIFGAPVADRIATLPSAPTPPKGPVAMTASAPFKFTASPASRGRILARIGLCGAGGSGKSYSALAIAAALRDRIGGGALVVIDSENDSALRYAKSAKTGRGFDFMHVPMPIDDYSPESYMRALDYAESIRAGVVLVDSISHEYDGVGGLLEIVDRNAGNGRDNFAGWRIATPMHKRFLQRLNSVEAHIIWTVRAKTAYEMRDDPKRPNKQTFQKVELGPVQRDGIEYEPDIFGWMADAVMTVDKTRCDHIEPRSEWVRPGADFAAALADWIEDAGPVASPAVPAWTQADLDAECIVCIAKSHETGERSVARARLVEWLRERKVPKNPIGAAALAKYDAEASKTLVPATAGAS